MFTADGAFFEWIDCPREHLPFVNWLRDASTYVYLYHPQPETKGYRVAAWRRDTAVCRRLVYDTGGVTLTNPPGFHEEIERRINSSGRTRSEVVQEVCDEMWPETYRRIMELKKATGPLRHEDLAIPEAEFRGLMGEAERHRVFAAVPRMPEGFHESSARILIRKGGGRENDLLTSYVDTRAGVGRFVTLAWRLAGYPPAGSRV
jgi:hypothetical protein